MNMEVVVVIGVGGIGQAIASRQGPGRASRSPFNEATLASAAKELDALGYRVTARRVDVSDRDSARSPTRSQPRTVRTHTDSHYSREEPRRS
jgi:saccharopine dehydrogenase-like NADP-dependent oxidoreductase